jgi:predicted kinase
VLVGGPPATGKSTLAHALGRRTGWTVLRSDEIRKRLAGREPEASAAAPRDQGLYAPAWTDRTYAALLDDARHHLERGRSVILDASWPDEHRRAQARRVADETASELTAFVCRIDPETAFERAARRAAAATDVSDAGPAIASDLAARFAAWPDAITIDTNDAPDTLARQAMALLGAAVSAE